MPIFCRACHALDTFRDAGLLVRLIKWTSNDSPRYVQFGVRFASLFPSCGFQNLQLWLWNIKCIVLFNSFILLSLLVHMTSLIFHLLTYFWIYTTGISLDIKNLIMLRHVKLVLLWMLLITPFVNYIRHYHVYNILMFASNFRDGGFALKFSSITTDWYYIMSN